MGTRLVRINKTSKLFIFVVQCQNGAIFNRLSPQNFTQRKNKNCCSILGIVTAVKRNLLCCDWLKTLILDTNYKVRRTYDSLCTGAISLKILERGILCIKNV